jgi:hypothetical protein
LGGATFSITPNPTGAATAFSVQDGDSNDLNSTAGLICVKAVAGSYSITETAAPNANWLKASPDTQTGIVASSTECATRTTTAGSENAKFVNTPLSKIEVKFTSSAGAGVTVASIVCEQGTTTKTTVAADTENLTDDPALDDTDETFSGLAPNTYTCTIVVDP